MLKKISFLMLIIVACIATSMAEDNAPAVTDVSISDIVAKNAAARGGLNAWRKVISGVNQLSLGRILMLLNALDQRHAGNFGLGLCHPDEDAGATS